MKYLVRFISLIGAVIKELADESAYARHLERHGVQASGEEWRRFCERRLESKYRRPKCC